MWLVGNILPEGNLLSHWVNVHSKDIPLVQHALNWRFELNLNRSELKISQMSLTAVNLSVSHSFVLSCRLSKQMWPLKNLKRFFDIISPKTKWLSFENSLSVIWRFTPSIPLKYIKPNNFNSIFLFFVFFFYPWVLAWLLLVTTSLQTCYSFIYPSVCAVSNFQSTNRKYLRCFQYCFLWSLGQDNLFYPK